VKVIAHIYNIAKANLTIRLERNAFGSFVIVTGQYLTYNNYRRKAHNKQSNKLAEEEFDSIHVDLSIFDAV